MIPTRQYAITSNIIKGSVKRCFADIKWLHTTLKSEFSGMLLPPLPENNRESINNYFCGLVHIDKLLTNHTLQFFISCVSEKLFCDFKIKKQIKRKSNNTSLPIKEPIKNVITNSISQKDLDELVYKSGKLSDLPMKDPKDYSILCAKISEISRHSTLIFAEIKKAVNSVKQQIAVVSKLFNHIANLFGNLALQSSKTSQYKDIYSDEKLKFLDMEPVYLKYKSLFNNAGKLTRKFI